MDDVNNYRSPLSTRYASEEMQYNFSDMKKLTTWRQLWANLSQAQKEQSQLILRREINLASTNQCGNQNVDLRAITGVKNLPLNQYLDPTDISSQFSDGYILLSDLNHIENDELASQYKSIMAVPSLSALNSSSVSTSPMSASLTSSPVSLVASSMSMTASSPLLMTPSSSPSTGSRAASSTPITESSVVDETDPIPCSDCSFMAGIVEPGSALDKSINNEEHTISYAYLDKALADKSKNYCNQYRLFPANRSLFKSLDQEAFSSFQDDFDNQDVIRQLRNTTASSDFVKIRPMNTCGPYELILEVPDVDLNQYSAFLSALCSKRFNSM